MDVLPGIWPGRQTHTSSCPPCLLLAAFRFSRSVYRAYRFSNHVWHRLLKIRSRLSFFRPFAPISPSLDSDLGWLVQTISATLSGLLSFFQQWPSLSEYGIWILSFSLIVLSLCGGMTLIFLYTASLWRSYKKGLPVWIVSSLLLTYSNHLSYLQSGSSLSVLVVPERLLTAIYLCLWWFRFWSSWMFDWLIRSLQGSKKEKSLKMKSSKWDVCFTEYYLIE